MKPPSERAREVLERYKAASGLGADEKSRLGDIVRERVLRGDLPRFDVLPLAASVPHASLAQKLWSTTIGKLGTAVLVAGAAGGIGYQLQKNPVDNLAAPATTVVRARLTASNATVPAPVAPQEPAPEPSTEAAQADAARVLPRPKERSAAPSADVAEPTIDDEVKLVSGAQTALRGGNTARAMQLLKEHETRFPAGKLATLRQVTYMMALCQSGQTAQARQAAARFLAKNPSSPFAERVSGICAAKPAP